ncbi:MAG TPA: hypothetical protein VEH55_00075 [Gaiellaceae bacterium]|nr:hypothetical protein [Gaiellaceae bacterium]
MNRPAVVMTAALVALLLAASIAAKTPYPPRAAGSGSEPTTGSGMGAGVSFRPRYALATYDGANYVLYLTQQLLACKDTLLAKPPYLTVTIVTGSPLVTGRPTVNSGDQSFVQVDFFVAPVHYYTVQPKVKLVLTRVDPTRNGVWHGRVTVPLTHFEGKTFSFDGTFAARWCGRVE